MKGDTRITNRELKRENESLVHGNEKKREQREREISIIKRKGEKNIDTTD